MVDFLILGPGNAIKYPDVMPLIIRGDIWFGTRKFTDAIAFMPGSTYDENLVSDDCKKEVDGQTYIEVNLIIWYTNIGERKWKPLEYRKTYSEEEYKKYDFFDAINIDDIRDIPDGYYGKMGVPVSFLEKWNPEEYEILGKGDAGRGGLDIFRPVVDGENKYVRILIRRKKDG